MCDKEIGIRVASPILKIRIKYVIWAFAGISSLKIKCLFWIWRLLYGKFSPVITTSFIIESWTLKKRMSFNNGYSKIRWYTCVEYPSFLKSSFNQNAELEKPLFSLIVCNGVKSISATGDMKLYIVSNVDVSSKKPICCFCNTYWLESVSLIIGIWVACANIVILKNPIIWSKYFLKFSIFLILVIVRVPLKNSYVWVLFLFCVFNDLHHRLF